MNPNKIGNAASFVMAPICVFLLIEFFAGMIFSDIKVFYRLHPKYLHATKANFKRSLINKRTGEKIIFRTSALGYRGDFTLDKRRRRIAVYGDSNVQALFDKEEDTFPVHLEKELKKSGKDFEIINAGTSGYGPDQNLLRMEDEIAVLKPDIIIFQIFTDNDFGDLIRNKIYDIKNGELIRKHPSVSSRIKLEYYCANSYICRTLKKIALKINFKKNKEKIDLVQLCEQEFESFKRDGVVDFSMWEDHYDVDLRVEPQAASSQYKINLMQLLIKELKKVNAAHPGVKILLLIEPSKNDIPQSNGAEPVVLEVIKSAAQDAGLKFLDLYPRFLEAGMERMYNNYDDHWSSRGQALAAILTADKIMNMEKAAA